MAKVDDSRIRVKRKWKSPSRYRFQFDKIAGAESVPIDWNSVDSYYRDLLRQITIYQSQTKASFLPEQIIHNNHLLDATTIHIIF